MSELVHPLIEELIGKTQFTLMDGNFIGMVPCINAQAIRYVHFAPPLDEKPDLSSVKTGSHQRVQF
jgi:hypothetical protein